MQICGQSIKCNFNQNVDETKEDSFYLNYYDLHFFPSFEVILNIFVLSKNRQHEEIKRKKNTILLYQ